MRTAAPKRRIIGQYTFDDGRSVEITCSDGIDSTKAIEIAQSLIKLKQDELGALRRPPLFRTAAE
jgi:hypothetical protein